MVSAFDESPHGSLHPRAPDQQFPGTRMSWVEPVFRIAAIAAFAALSHADMGISCGSFIRPRITWSSERNSLASLDQKLANALTSMSSPTIAAAPAFVLARP